MRTLDNTWLFLPNPITGQLSGLGLVQPYDAGFNIPGTDIHVDNSAVTAANSELGFLTNWWRSINGQAPLPAQSSAPTVNVGLDPGTQQMLMLGGAALLAVVLLRKKRGGRKSRR